jgi:RHS repeat-associated protein
MASRAVPGENSKPRGFVLRTVLCFGLGAAAASVVAQDRNVVPVDRSIKSERGRSGLCHATSPGGPGLPPADKPYCTPCLCKTSPCYAANGNFFTDATDLQVPAVGGPLVASRHYDSARPVDGAAGVGWSSSMAIRLFYATFVLSPGVYQRQAFIAMEAGTHLQFQENSDGVTYVAGAGHRDILVKNGDGSFDLTPQQSRTRYHFSSSGALQSFVDANGNSRTYTYDANGRLQRVADDAGSGRYLDVFFGPDGRISTVRDSTGRQEQYLYNTGGNLTSATDPAGRITTYQYTTTTNGSLMTAILDHWGRTVMSVGYDANARVLHLLDGGRNFTYTYAVASVPNRTAKIDDSLGGYGWVFTFDANGLITDRQGIYIGTNSGFGGIKHTDFNPDATVQQVVDEVGIKTYYTYDSSGRVLTVTRDYQGALAVRFEYSYDPSFADKVTAIHPVDPATGQPNTDWQGWEYDYYQAGSPSPGSLFHVYRKRSDGTSDTLATYVYDTHGRVTSQVNATGGTTDYEYDGTGNLWHVTGPANNDLLQRPVTTYLYDSAGRVTSVSDPLGHITTYTYDAVDRVLTVTLPKPSPASPLTFTTTYAYDSYNSQTGLLSTSVTDPNGRTTSQGYDAWGQLIKSTDAAGGLTTYIYTNGPLTSILDANGNLTSYTYDVLGRLIQTTFPDAAIERYTYNDDATLQTKFKGVVGVGNEYDSLKRVSTSKTQNFGNRFFHYTGQKLTSVDYFTTNVATYTYDSSYRLSGDTQVGIGTIAYTYNADDSRASYSVTGGPTASFTYYPDGSLNTIQWSPAAGLFKYQYRLNGQYSSLAFPNGLSRAYSYDDQGRLAQVSNVDPVGGNIATYAYGYDLNYTTGAYTMLGQRVSQTATVPSQGLNNHLTKYEYDPLYQLAKSTYPNVAPFNGEIDSWTYDAIGNRLTNTVNGSTQNYTYQKITGNSNNWQRLLSDGSNSYTYDANGDTASKSGPGGNFTFGWYDDGHLWAIAGAVTSSYSYDHQGRRTSKTVSSVTTNYLYDGQNLIQELGATPADYLFGPGIDEPLAMSRSGQVYYHSTDALGSVVAITNAAGTIQNSYLFDAWGQTRTQTGSLANPFTYTAREQGEAGSLFYRARYYSPAVGRFLSEDPLRTRSSPYAYVESDPIASRDPLGLYTYRDFVTFSNDAVAGSWTQFQTFIKLEHRCFACHFGNQWRLTFDLSVHTNIHLAKGAGGCTIAAEMNHVTIFDAYAHYALDRVKPYEAMPYNSEADCEAAAARGTAAFYQTFGTGLWRHTLVQGTEELYHNFVNPCPILSPFVPY